ncbi:hypothetical protein MPLDJ20_60529 [Mesorhizobium plurifarium]|uniref:Uncharacterized protein n=1 Tax=Mesorhizobium plurifarium TaxID=69974 RepID=A0A090FR78_MESPL|nr:hypothetical protein MPLDJ20_60529 [Mesorhizobium plurifarium]
MERSNHRSKSESIMIPVGFEKLIGAVQNPRQCKRFSTEMLCRADADALNHKAS